MQIEVYDMLPEDSRLTITLEAICDTFSSLLWDVEYYQCGCFEVYIAASPRNIEIFRTGRIVGRDDDNEHFGLIESVKIETDAEDGDYLIVGGRFLMCLLERRIIYPTLNITTETAYSEIVQSAVRRNAIDSAERKISGLKLGTVQGECWNEKPSCRSATQTLWSGSIKSVRKQAVQQIFGLIKSAVRSTKWYADPCNCDSRIQQLEDRFIYEIHDIREEFEQSIHKHENINLLNQIQSDNIHTHSNKI